MTAGLRAQPDRSVRKAADRFIVLVESSSGPRDLRGVAVTGSVQVQVPAVIVAEIVLAALVVVAAPQATVDFGRVTGVVRTGGVGHAGGVLGVGGDAGAGTVMPVAGLARVTGQTVRAAGRGGGGPVTKAVQVTVAGRARNPAVRRAAGQAVIVATGVVAVDATGVVAVDLAGVITVDLGALAGRVAVAIAGPVAGPVLVVTGCRRVQALVHPVEVVPHIADGPDVLVSRLMAGGAVVVVPVGAGDVVQVVDGPVNTGVARQHHRGRSGVAGSDQFHRPVVGHERQRLVDVGGTHTGEAVRRQHLLRACAELGLSLRVFQQVQDEVQ